MDIRAKLTWITLTMLALGAERAAVAEPAPVRVATASDPTLAAMQQRGASVGPELEAARASLAAATKKNDKGSTLDLNRMGNRQATAGDNGSNVLSLPSAAGAPLQSKPGGGDSLQLLHGDATGATSTEAGPAARVVPVGDMQQSGASAGVPALHPEAVIRGQINPAAKGCYANDPDSKSRRPGRLIILIKLTPTGEIDSVNVANNVGVSPSVVTCVTAAARAANFAPPGPNGATIPAAFAFPGQADPPPPAAAPAKDAPPANASGHAARETLAQTDIQPTRP